MIGIRPGRKQPTHGPQQVTRIPDWRPGRWVKIKVVAYIDLAGKVRQVKALTCSLDANEKALWRVHFHDGRCVPHRQIERFATEQEIAEAKRRQSL